MRGRRTCASRRNLAPADNLHAVDRHRPGPKKIHCGNDHLCQPLGRWILARYVEQEILARDMTAIGEVDSECKLHPFRGVRIGLVGFGVRVRHQGYGKCHAAWSSKQIPYTDIMPSPKKQSTPDTQTARFHLSGRKAEERALPPGATAQTAARRACPRVQTQARSVLIIASIDAKRTVPYAAGPLHPWRRHPRTISELDGVAQGEWRMHRVGDIPAEQLAQQFHKREVTGHPVERVPYGDGQSAASRTQHPQHLANGIGLDSTNIKANWLTTASKLALVNGKASALPICHSTSPRFPRATASICSFGSIPTTCPSGATRSAAAQASTPVPQPTSSTRSPAPTAAASAMRGPHGRRGQGQQLVIDHRWVSLRCVFPVDVHLLSPMVIKTLIVFADR